MQQEKASQQVFYINIDEKTLNNDEFICDVLATFGVNQSTVPDKQLLIKLYKNELEQTVRIYPGNVKINVTFKKVSYDKDTEIIVLLKNALKKFRLEDQEVSRYFLTVTPLDEATGKYISAGYF
jgi:hypothetical protein